MKANVLLCRSAIAKMLAAAIILTVAVAIAGAAYYLTLPAPSLSPTQTPTPTPPTLISFEEAVEYALNLGTVGHFVWRPWNYSEHRSTGELQGEPAVTENGLLTGYLEWRASDGRLYQAEYPSDANATMPPRPSILGEVEHFVGGEDVKEYYVWRIRLMDGAVVWVDAQNGDILSDFSSRCPGILSFETAARVINAPQKTIEEWSVQKYERIADYESEGQETPDGLVKGHLLRRLGNGTLYEVHLPFENYLVKKVLMIEAPEDTEEYNIWEITAEKKSYYIDARNGIIRYITDFQ